MGSEAAPDTVEVIRWQWTFQDWANERLFEAIAPLMGDDAVFAPGSVWPDHDDRHAGQADSGWSLFNGLTHIVAAESHWLRRWQGQPHSALAAVWDYSADEGISRVFAESRATRAARLEWLSRLSPSALGEDCRFFRSDGSEDAIPFWQTLLHVANHSTHHRAELYVVITGLRLADALDQLPEATSVEELDARATAARPPSVDLIDWVRAGCPGAAGR